MDNPKSFWTPITIEYSEVQGQFHYNLAHQLETPGYKIVRNNIVDIELRMFQKYIEDKYTRRNDMLQLTFDEMAAEFVWFEAQIYAGTDPLNLNSDL